MLFPLVDSLGILDLLIKRKTVLAVTQTESGNKV